MPRGSAHFSSDELAKVLSHYDIGIITNVTPLNIGNKRSPKAIISSQHGRFFLKRRPTGRIDAERVALAHDIQIHLADRGFPVAGLIATIDGKTTILNIDEHIYELFRFVKGGRHKGDTEATADAGRQLARFHLLLESFKHACPLPRDSFHDSRTVRRHLKTVQSKKGPIHTSELQTIADDLTSVYNDASVSVSRLGFDNWPTQIVHGDWHPGNMLFSENKLVAVLDFDSLREASPVTDLANGMLQFSIVANRPNPADWPDYLDESRLARFLSGYREIIEPDRDKLRCLIDLMIETLIAEAVLPVAATGFFGNLTGLDFLQMILRKARWLVSNRLRLLASFE